MRQRPWLFILIPLLLHSAEALAWGLATHLYFSQLLLWAVPLLDPRLRAAAKRLPHLVLAGSCLPDLALVGRSAKTEAFEDSHHWEQAAGLLARAESDEARAIALGYASHLFVDIIAHNHFVPAHERMWLKLPMVTHAMSEWAMDAHIAHHLFAMPPRLLRDHHAILAQYITAEFDCDIAEAERALVYLRHATAFLYGSRAHRMLYVGAASLDRHLTRRFDYYVTETAARLPQINRLLVGEAPCWRADFACPERTGHLKHLSRDEARGALPLPVSLFA
ncbi:MAG: zinc dependent phospholipase C family protein [Burkholderiales bacterium]|nr:zinc dependent phospholipase C family protein [Burkholderiales bacterium]